jgi:predicted amidohydrolase YtcJ
MTVWAAYANFEEDMKGSIEVGKLADMVVLKQDIMDIDIHQVPQVDVVATLVDGAIVYKLPN